MRVDGITIGWFAIGVIVALGINAFSNWPSQGRLNGGGGQ